MYTYKCRPGYGSKDLMIEFESGTENKSFLKDLAKALQAMNAKISSSKNVWMNDEVWINISSKHGNFTLTKDNWGLVFIMTQKNQVGMMILDQLLAKNGMFEKIDHDPLEYA